MYGPRVRPLVEGRRAPLLRSAPHSCLPGGARRPFERWRY